MNPFKMEADIRSFSLITHAVQAERIRPHLPAGYELETFGGLGLVSVGSFRSENFHWSGLPNALSPSMNFEQLTYRTYVRYRGRESVYFFATVIEDWKAFALQRAISPSVFHGTFAVTRESGSGAELENIACRISSEIGETEFELAASRSKPSKENEAIHGVDLPQFLTYRLHGLIQTTVGIEGDQIVEHSRMQTFDASISRARFEPWEWMGILGPEEAASPVSVLYVPRIHFAFFPPVPARLLAPLLGQKKAA